MYYGLKSLLLLCCLLWMPRPANAQPGRAAESAAAAASAAASGASPAGAGNGAGAPGSAAAAQTPGQVLDNVVSTLTGSKAGTSAINADLVNSVGEMLNVDQLTRLVQASSVSDAIKNILGSGGKGSPLPGGELIAPGLTQSLQRAVAQGAVEQFTRPLQRLTDGGPLVASDVTDIINSIPELSQSVPVVQEVDFNKIPPALVDHLVTDGYIPGVPQSTSQEYLRAYMLRLHDTAKLALQGDASAARLLQPFDQLPKVIQAGGKLPGLNETQLDTIKQYYGEHFTSSTTPPTTTTTPRPTTTTVQYLRPHRPLYDINDSDRNVQVTEGERALSSELIWLLSAVGVSVGLLLALGVAVGLVLYYRRRSKSMKADMTAPAYVDARSSVRGEYSRSRDSSFMRGTRLAFEPHAAPRPSLSANRSAHNASRPSAVSFQTPGNGRPEQPSHYSAKI